MPHFIIDCSEHLIEEKSPEDIIKKVYDAAESTGLFLPEEIKVRINPFRYYNTGNTSNDFIHVFANIMQGRSIYQKQRLSKTIVLNLKEMFDRVAVISTNIRDFEEATYCNRSMV